MIRRLHIRCRTSRIGAGPPIAVSGFRKSSGFSGLYSPRLDSALPDSPRFKAALSSPEYVQHLQSKNNYVQHVNLRFATRLRALRDDRKLSVEEFANCCNLSAHEIRSLESCKHELTLDTLSHISRSLGLDLSELMDGV